MIKLHSSRLAPDYTEYGRVTTDCKTVGDFMTEAASIYGGELTIKVDGCRYEFSDNPKMKVADYTPIDDVTYASVPGRMTFIVRTKPKTNTVRKSGYVNLYKVEGVKPIPVGFVYKTKTECEADGSQIVNKEDFLIVAKVEWKEEVK